ncbi:T9SS type A sorting domain-containing protein [Flavobacterium nackdongense]|uniref:T9SS type A sorting domain-containing protein n=1 Tax=Flavobacterium nackdongense TaxID=2547394 RepID=A0A4P6YC22_9FLAO|nr:T9SS type A sorting domain-containing protein [Flavobacterium nackdongense]QBN17843.1 T9SS type A sorting domain-containing protein [Flavobacterium nackdongense]
MKNTYFLKAVFTLILCGFFSMTYAGTIYLSATGNDSNNGLSMGTAVKSFSVAQGLAADGDTIMVSGLIDFVNDPGNTATTTTSGPSTTNKVGIVITKNLNIQGTSSDTDGFQGVDTQTFINTRFIQLTADFTLGLKNLKLINGALITDLTTVAAGGGAILMTNGAIVAENVVFDSNTTSGHSAISGGAIYIGGSNGSGKATSFKNCVFNANEGTKGGPIYIQSVGNGGKITFEGCAITNNLANGTTGGSAFYIRFNAPTGKPEINIINCTIRGNKVTANNANGGAINWSAKTPNTAYVNIVNSTITENTTGGSSTAGAGIYFAFGTNATGNYGNLTVSNCIVEGNKTDAGVASDMQVKADAATGTAPENTVGYIAVKNSMIGAVTSLAANVPTANITDATYYNYITTLTPDLKAMLVRNNPDDLKVRYYTLGDGSPAITFGKSTFLSPITTDQLGKTRPSTTDISAGSVEKNPVLGLRKNLDSAILVYRNANNQITVENSTNDYTGSITVYNTLGQVVAKTAATGARTTIEKSLNAGVYIVRLNTTAGSAAKKVIIN